MANPCLKALLGLEDISSIDQAKPIDLIVYENQKKAGVTTFYDVI